MLTACLPPHVCPDQAEREHWSELLLGWMSEQPLEAALQHAELLRALAGALAGGQRGARGL
jgi:hypothetical protein